MGSFQQILMGATCLFAAFLFGSYLHNRPAQNPAVGENVVAPADPIDSLLAFGKREPAMSPTVVPVRTPAKTQGTASIQHATIDPSELAPVLVSNSNPAATVQQPNNLGHANPLPRKPVVPDFSELASRFRNTALDLDSPASLHSGEDPIHASERVQYSGTFKAPEMVIRQPDLPPLPRFQDAFDRVEQAGAESVSIADAPSSRWRVEQPRNDSFGSFEAAPQTRQFAKPQFINRERRETIEDVVSNRSADWLKESETFGVGSREELRETPLQKTFATNSPQSEGWNSLRKRRATEQAAQRNRDLLDIEDPGNRFRSGDVSYQSPPEPSHRRYYRPTAERQDNYPANHLRGSQTRLRSIQNSLPQNVSRQSNVDRSFEKRYEIKTGDTLQSISTQFYGTPEHYLSIYRANRGVLDRITSSPVGVVIEIPNIGN